MLIKICFYFICIYSKILNFMLPYKWEYSSSIQVFPINSLVSLYSHLWLTCFSINYSLLSIITHVKIAFWDCILHYHWITYVGTCLHIVLWFITFFWHFPLTLEATLHLCNPSMEVLKGAGMYLELGRLREAKTNQVQVVNRLGEKQLIYFRVS